MAKRVTRRDLLTGRLPMASVWEPAGAGLVAWMDGRGVEHDEAAPGADRIARILMDRCLAHMGGLCSTCVERCPKPGAIGLVDDKPVVDPDVCNGCHVCADMCPVPRPAIRMTAR